MTSTVMRKPGLRTARSGLPTVAAVLGLVLLAGAASAQEATEPERPTVCLVLSGGGAFGLAHVGVLQVLDELRVPIDCIAGTSMGAIVGGLTAAGLGPEDLVEVLSSIDWRSVFDDRPPRRQVPFRRKVDDLTYLSRFEIGFNHGKFQLPPGLVSGQQFGFLLEALTVPVAGVSDFDQLRLPFRAVATDVETGEKVVLSSGDLGRALRASMAVPGIFTPVTIGDRLLVDGGLVDNLPVDVAREMGADVVIAVDVSSPLRTREELGTLTGMTSQVVGLMIRSNVAPQAADADILIDPDLVGLSSSDFEQWREMLPRGEAAARAAADSLRRYAVSEEAYASWRNRVRRLEPTPERVAGIQVTTSSDADPELVLRRVRTRPGDTFDIAAVRRDVERLYELGDYESVGFFLTHEPDGYLVHIEAHEKSWGPNVVRFGLNMASDFEGEGSYGVLASYNATRLNRLRAELKVAVEIGTSPRASVEYYQPLSLGGRVFAAGTIEHEREIFEVASGPYPVGSYRVQAGRGALELGLNLGRWGEVRAGVTAGLARATPRLVAGEIAGQSFDAGGWIVRGIIDQLDNPNFPHQGYIATAELYASRQNLGSDQDYDRLELGYAVAASLQRHTLFLSLGWGSALNTELPIYDRFALGGLFRLSGTPRGRITGQYYGAATLIYLYRLGSLPPAAGNGFYLGVSIEAANAWETRDEVSLGDLRRAGSLAFGADTVVGPVYVGWGRNSLGNDAWYLYLGRTF